ncbi:MAG: hypothetical protein PHX52_01480 [Candidatus Pacebacteria bacterium]|nr:hypothetical protein [Candidatus Paceibacterota bacterium]MDD3919237.1 hypothetical protein [Candidatus Paceibacterota bacterium]
MQNFLIETWYLILPFLEFGWAIFLSIWWLFLIYYAQKFLHFSYLAWKNTQWALENMSNVLLEIKFPREILKPLKTMENVFSVIWGAMYDPPNMKEKYFEGKFLLSFSLEIVSLEGVPHFYIRIPRAMKKVIEAAVNSQYADVEFTEVADYTRQIPQDLPNKEWDLWGCNFMPTKDDVYPIKTYDKFFEQKTDAAFEEKRMDPITDLIEACTKIGKGEQLWFQILACSAGDDENDYVKRGKAIVNELSKRPGVATEKNLFQKFVDVFTGNFGEEAKPDNLLPPEMFLTTGEREIVSAIEEKISKLAFECSVRFVYLGKKDVFRGANKAIGPSYMNQFVTKNLNALLPWKRTITKIQPPDIMQERRVYLRKRDLFLRYIRRDYPFSPFGGGTVLLNTEELATLFHFPGFEVAPTAQFERLEIKKAPPPPTLPVED